MHIQLYGVPWHAKYVNELGLRHKQETREGSYTVQLLSPLAATIPKARTTRPKMLEACYFAERPAHKAKNNPR
jgi:hypothetical protein